MYRRGKDVPVFRVARQPFDQAGVSSHAGIRERLLHVRDAAVGLVLDQVGSCNQVALQLLEDVQ